MEPQSDTTLVILLFEHFTALDIIGPYEVFSRLKGSKIYFAGKEKKSYKDLYGLELFAGYPLSKIKQADILLIPGGFGIDAFLKDQEIIQWIRTIDQTSQWTTAVCSGALLLAETGLLDNRICTTHWRRKDHLAKYKVTFVNDRYVRDRKYITSAGVSAGIDMALYLAGQVAGELSAKTIQLSMEYDPQPPYDCGSPEKALREILTNLK